MKTLLLLLTLFALQFSAIGQTITVNKDKICFDSIAAIEAFNEIKLKDQIIIAQDSIITNRDSLILVTTKQSDNLILEYSKLVDMYNFKNDENIKMSVELVRARKESKVWFKAFLVISTVFFGAQVLR